MFEEVHRAESYIIDSVGPDDDAALRGMKWLIEFAKKHGHSTAGLFVATLKQAAHFSRFLGAPVAEALLKRRQISVEGVSIKLLTERTLPSDFDGPVLGMWVHDEHLESLETLRCAAICAVPYQPNNVANWKLARKPLDLKTGLAASAGPKASRVLAAALRDLSDSVNVGTGLVDPSDKGSAIDLFRTLLDAQEPFDGRTVRAIASQLGWSGAHARALGELAEKIAGGKQVRSRDPFRGRWGEASLVRWRAGDQPED